MNAEGVGVSAPRFDHLTEPLGIGTPTPRLSFTHTAPRGWALAAYEVELTGRGDRPLRSGRIDSTDTVLVRWPFQSLRSRERVSLRIRVTGTDGSTSAWGPAAEVEAGLLQPADWSARAVSPREDIPSDGDNRPWLLRSEFTVAKPVRSARLYATAQGVYEIEINGARVGDETLAPGWTSYSERLRYQSHDVTERLTPGANAIGAHLADGWYRGRLGFHGGHPNLYGDRVALFAQLEITYTDGTSELVTTDAGWRASAGPLLRANLLRGERYDARAEQTGWSQPHFDDSRWAAVDVVPLDPATLVAPEGPPVRCTEELAPVSVTRSAEGQILDFGQNLVGRLRIEVQGRPGDLVRIRHAEVLQDGELYTRPLRGATSVDEYTLASTEPETWEPRFTIHGFRYAEIIGWTGGDLTERVRARVYHSDMRRTGDFACSNPDVTRLHENIVWSMRGNFVDLPTDCPQRDERLGWTGDIQVFAPTASFLYDCAGLLSSWLKDVAAEQLPDGTVPWFVPSIPGGDEWTPSRPGAGWGDAAVLTPWALYERFGDRQILENQWPSARAWVDLVHRASGDDLIWDGGFQLGDWLDPSAPPDDPAAGLTDKYLVSTAYAYRSTDRLSRMAGVLGRVDDERRYADAAARIRTAFRHRYLRSGVVLTSDSQTAYALAIVFGLLDDAELPAAGEHLARLVGEAGDTLTTGFLGTPLILDALSSTGRRDVAYRLLLQENCPSWLYPVKSGATTIWERWDSMLPDGTVNPGEMTSFNHYAFGAVGDWLHRVVAGIQATSPGFRSVVFAPEPGGGLTSARAAHHSAYGPIEIDWRLDGDHIVVTTTVPTGVDAVLRLPDGTRTSLASGRQTLRSAVAVGQLS